MSYRRYGITYVALKNDPRSPCGFAAFQWLIDAFGISGGGFDVPGRKKGKKNVDKKKKSDFKFKKFAIDINVKLPEEKASQPSATEYLDIFFQNEDVDKLYRSLLRGKGAKGNESNNVEAFEVVWRSPERMVRFLGDVIAAQNLTQEPREIKIRISKKIVDLFVVRRGRGISEKSAVAVVDSEGEEFYVPIPDYASPTKHVSLQALALVMDFLNSAVSGKVLPQPTTLVVTGG